jgi:hypothetical protein
MRKWIRKVVIDELYIHGFKSDIPYENDSQRKNKWIDRFRGYTYIGKYPKESQVVSGIHMLAPIENR